MGAGQSAPLTKQLLWILSLSTAAEGLWHAAGDADAGVSRFALSHLLVDSAHASLTSKGPSAVSDAFPLRPCPVACPFAVYAFLARFVTLRAPWTAPGRTAEAIDARARERAGQDSIVCVTAVVVVSVEDTDAVEHHQATLHWAYPSPREKQRGEVVSMQRITSTSCLQRWLYRGWRWRCPDWANGTTMEDRPRLPLEILEQIVLELRRPCSLGDPVAQRTLSALSLVSRTVRHWALAAKYSVVVAPRHVREFRKWHGRVHEEMVGYNRALFVALDDVSSQTGCQSRTCFSTSLFFLSSRSQS